MHHHDLQGDDGMSALHTACAQSCALGVIRILISAGAKVNLLDKRGTSPLHHGCSRGNLGAVRALISAGADVNVRSYQGSHSSLHLASTAGYTEVVHALLSAGAEVDALTWFGTSSLHLASGQGHLEVIRALLSAGGQADLRATIAGTIPLDVLPSALRPEVLRLVQRAKEERSGAAVGLHPRLQPASLLQLRLRACGRCKSVRYCSEEALEGGRPQGGMPAAAGGV